MQLNLVILVGFILLSTGCVNKVTHPPSALEGVDIYDGKIKGDVCFSKMYLENYLQWKHDNCQQ